MTATQQRLSTRHAGAGRHPHGPNHWAIAYVGKPYEEADCAELAVLVQAEQFNRTLELPTDRCPGPFGLSAMIGQHRRDFAERTDFPEDGDAVLMRVRGRLNHVGIYCDIGGTAYVLHALKSAGQACLHRIADLPPLQIEIEGFYTWL